MFCPRCGKELINNGCPNCGYVVNQPSQYQPANNIYPPEYSVAQQPYIPEKPDESSVGLNILSYFIPIFGIIWYFVKKSEKPKEAKGTLKTAIASIIINTAISLILMLLMFVGLFAGFGAVIAGDTPTRYEQGTEITTQTPSDNVTQAWQDEDYFPGLPHSIAFQDYQIEIGEAKITLPISYRDFCEQTGFGKGYAFDNRIELGPRQLETVSVVYADCDNPLMLTVMNTSSQDDPKPLDDCMVVGITQLGDCGTPIVFANGTYVGMENAEEYIKGSFGEPDEVDENDLYCRMTFYEDPEIYGGDRSFTITIRVDNDVITEISTTKLR